MTLVIKNMALVLCAACWLSCGPTLKLTIPDTFKQQATMQHVEGARKNRMSFAAFKTSRIKRGGHMTEEAAGRGFILQNLLLNRIGVSKNETINREAANFRYTLSDGKNMARIAANEIVVSDKVEYEAFKSTSIFNKVNLLQHYSYVFSALITADSPQGSNSWELLMTNVYERKQKDMHPFAFIRPDYNGLATNGEDTIFVKAINTRKTQMPNGKMAELPFDLLSGYELSTSDGVIAIIDLTQRDIWFYNELDDADKLNVGAIATAIFGRRVRDEKW